MDIPAQPKGVLFDFGGTLVEESGLDLRAGNQWLLSRASRGPADLNLDAVLLRATAIGQQVVAQRESIHVEIPWPAILRLIYDHLGVEFDDAIPDLELGFWQASVTTGPVAGVAEALDALASAGIRMAVVSNTSFSARTLRSELEKHALAHHFQFIVTSAEYSIRKPNPLLFEVAARRLGVAPADLWFVGDRSDTDVAGANAAGMTSVMLGIAPQAGPPAKPALRIAGWHEWPRWT